MQHEWEGDLAFARERQGKGALVPALQAGPPCDRQRLRAFSCELRLEHEKRNAAEMIGVKMRQQNHINCIAVDSESLHRNKRRSAAIDQTSGSLCHNMKASVEAPARTEGVAGADKC